MTLSRIRQRADGKSGWFRRVFRGVVAGLARVQEVLAIRPKSGDVGYEAGLAEFRRPDASAYGSRVRPKSGDIDYTANPQSLADRFGLANGHCRAIFPGR